MDVLQLKAKIRQVRGKDNKKLRRNNIIPAIIYGRDFKPLSIEINYLDFKKVFEEAGESSLIDLIVDNKNPLKVLIQEVQSDPGTDRFIHADFHQVKMTEKITTEVILKFVGESLAVKELNGVLVKNLDRVEVQCLPGDLVHEIFVNLSSLKTFDDIIYVRDLKIPLGIKLLEKEDEVVAKVVPPRTEEELKALEEAPEEKVEEVEKVEKEKKEGEESEEEAAKKEKEEKGKKKEEEKKEGEKKNEG